MEADQWNSKVYADIGELYIRECVAVRDSTTSDQDNHKEGEHERPEGPGGTTLGVDYDRGNNRAQEEGITRAELDRKKDGLLETYTCFYKQLWPDERPETLDDLSYYSPMAADVKEKSQEFRDAVHAFGRRRIAEEICVFYDTIKLSGALPKKKQEQGSTQDDDQEPGLNLWDPNPEVSLRVSGNETITLKWHDATLGYLDHYYPDDGQDDVHRIPTTMEVENDLKYKLGASDGTSKTTDPPNPSERTPTEAKADQKEGREVGPEGRNLRNTLPDARRSNIISSETCAPGPDDLKKSKSSAEGKGTGKKMEVGNLSLRTELERNELLLTKFRMLPGGEQKKREQYHIREKARIAEEEMLTAFEQWGKRLWLNMYIIGGYSFDSFLKNVIGQPLYISKLYKGEFDILIICQELGVILIEVKSSVAAHCVEGNNVGSTHRSENRETASLSTIAKDLAKAWGQLMTRNFVVREMNRDLHFVKGLPVKAFIGVPFLTTADLSKVSICTNHRKYILCGDQLNNLDEWLLGHFPSLKYHRNIMSQEPNIPSRRETFEKCLSRNDYRKLVSRFVGRVSAVTTETDTIRDTSRKMTCAFLTPQQRSVLDKGREHTTIFGDYGTGKTLLLIKKALALAISKNGGAIENIRVHYVPCCDVSNFEACYGVTFWHQAELVKKFIDKLDKDQSKCIVCYKCFFDFFKTVTGSNTRVFSIELVKKAIRSAMNDGSEDNVKHHFFFDEFPIQSLQDGGLQRIYNSVQCVSDSKVGSPREDNALRELQNTYLWVSIATHSLGVFPDNDPSKALLDKLKVMPNEVSYVYLNKVMRVSKQVYEMIRLIEGYIEKGHGMLSNLGHMVHGMKPRLYRLPPRTCGDEATTLGCECGCIRKRMSATLRRIIDSLEAKEGKNTIEVTIMLYYVMSSPMFNRMYSLLNAVANDISGDEIITLEWNTMQYHAKNKTESIYLDGLALSDGANRSGVAEHSPMTWASKLDAAESVESHQLSRVIKKETKTQVHGEQKQLSLDGLTLVPSNVPRTTNVTDKDRTQRRVTGSDQFSLDSHRQSHPEQKIKTYDNFSDPGSTVSQADESQTPFHLQGSSTASTDAPSSEKKSGAGGATPLMIAPELDDVMSEDMLHTDMDSPERKGGPTSKYNKKKVTIRVVDQRTFAGCETPVLIFIDLFEMRHWFKRGRGTGSGYHSLIFTRCTGHFILITWPKDEAHVMWEKHLDEYGEEIDRSNASVKYKQGRHQYIDSGRAAHAMSGATYLDLLLNKNAIEDKSVEVAPSGDVGR